MPLLPFSIGRWCLLITGIGSVAFIAYRLGAKPLTLAFFLLSYPVLADLANGNIEWMPLLGFVPPPRIGRIFELIKPQVGIETAIYWSMGAWREGGIRRVTGIFSPIIILSLFSFALYGFWPLYFLNTLELAKQTQSNLNLDYNASLWPFGVIIGLALLIRGIQTKNHRLRIMSGPFLSPYALIATYAT